MRAVQYLSLVFAICCMFHLAKLVPQMPEAGDNNYNALSGRPCIQECQARCGGICYLNMMAFKYVCICRRIGK